MISHDFTFKKAEKLKSRKLIASIFKEGKSFSHFPFRVVYLFPEKNTSYLQVGFSVSIKNFKKATDRNKIKRLMREAYRLQKLPLTKELTEKEIFMTLFVLYTGNEIPSYENVFEKMETLLLRLQKMVSS
ncbi:MAG: ribonuclease P protein component [Ginsengibacter sp.]